MTITRWTSLFPLLLSLALSGCSGPESANEDALAVPLPGWIDDPISGLSSPQPGEIAIVGHAKVEQGESNTRMAFDRAMRDAYERAAASLGIATAMDGNAPIQGHLIETHFTEEGDVYVLTSYSKLP